MGSFARLCALGLVAAGLYLVQGAQAHAGCVGLSGTADGVNKVTAVSRSQNAVNEAINEYKAAKRLGATRVSPMRAKPQPYWRDSVSDHLFQKPDIVTARSHTVCWSGVVSPFVCTSGAKLCW
jgi:hypothetical protein